ncbi:MAG: DUF2306 domain-containing protein [Gemmatimonadales bacterium]
MHTRMHADREAGDNRRPRSGTVVGVLLTIAALTGAWSIWRFAWPILSTGDVGEHLGHFELLYVHVIGGTALLAVGAASLYIGSTKRAFRWHRTVGYMYLIAGGTGALLGVVLSLANTHSDPILPLALDLTAVSETGWALATQGVAWLIAASMALRAARNRRFDSHRGWMIRGYVIAWGFALGSVLGGVPAIGELGDGAAIRWLTWVVPLLVCEAALQWRDTSVRARDVRVEVIS